MVKKSENLACFLHTLTLLLMGFLAQCTDGSVFRVFRMNVHTLQLKRVDYIHRGILRQNSTFLVLTLNLGKGYHLNLHICNHGRFYSK